MAWPDFGDTGESSAPVISLRLSPHLHDGRWANNPWLQELPAPFSHLVWDNAALISVTDAKRLHLINGSVIACEHGGGRVEAPVWLTPGQAEGVITLTLGYGRTHTGEIGQGVGYDAYPLRTNRNLWTLAGATITALPRFHVLVSTQGHFAMEDRDLVRRYAPDEVAKLSGRKEPPPSIFPEWPRDRHAWGMSIDLGTCIGCQACVTACQAENNIPSVGKDQVLRGREMLWIRIDRYFEGDPANPRFLHQPVPCMQCEHAPCEVVCPVAATVHSSEGLNDMVYNRCVGTRYCSNNCPYKVRRFNFLDYRQPAGSPLHLQENPDVTVRARGVMEKCTYCVQRINAGRIRAERENRALRDGEIRTACQQACPVEAIVFGDLNDPQSRVRQRKTEPTSYALLEDLNTRPRTTYLARVQHRAPARGEGEA
jgi:molybdopterin-containing oxidoreductase family iron-sulfur binding subunit